MKRLLQILMVLVAFNASTMSLAVNPDEVLADPALEARARDISYNLRCLVCQNQSIDDSDADLARDLRLLVRERLQAGDSNEETVQYLVDRYGEFVLLKPVMAWHTLALWLAAPVALVGGIVLLVILGRRRKLPDPPTALSASEQEALDALLADDADDDQDEDPTNT